MNLPSLLSHSLFVSFAVQLILAYEWLSGGFSKIYKAQFVPSMGKTLLRFEEGNPHGWYTDTFLNTAKTYPSLFGMLVQWGELLTGIGLIAALALFAFSKHSSSKQLARYIGIASLFGGAFLNLNFYVAAGWTSPSTAGLNALMFWVQIILLIMWIALPQKKSTVQTGKKRPN